MKGSKNDQLQKLNITKADVWKNFFLKHGDLRTTGWAPKMQFRFGYFSPDTFYEALINNLVWEGCAWLDVGSGRNIFPHNQPLAKILSRRCSLLVGIDPSDTIDENTFLHQRVKDSIENFHSKYNFDIATLRMVAEHITNPTLAISSLAKLIKPEGKVIIYTVNKLAPISIISSITPFCLHHLIKQLLWTTEEKDTFPVTYKMNTRKRLANSFKQYGFKESFFIYLDDCRTFGGFRFLNFLELSLWRLLKAKGLNYPENCLLGVYEKNKPE